MANGDLHLLGTFYKAGVKHSSPMNPWRKGSTTPLSGNIPAFSAGQTLEIRDTDPSDAYKIKWRELVVGSKKLLIADRNILEQVSWDDLNAQSLVTGKEITIDGRKYKLRLMTGGSNFSNSGDAYAGGMPTANEWDQIISGEANYPGLPKPTASDLDSSLVIYDLDSAHNQFWNWFYMYSWVQEAYTPSGWNRVIRGYNSARYFGFSHAANRDANVGWRPVLEVLNAAPTVTPIPNQSTTMGANKTVNLANHFTDADGDSLTYTVTSANTGAATASVSGNTLTLMPQALGSTSITVTANDGKGGTVSTTFTFTVVNSLPTLTLNTTNNQTLYENDTFKIDGTARDLDVGNIVNAKYQINAGTVRALVVDISTGANIPFNKQLAFKGGILYDGATAVTGALSEGTAHTLKVWSEDDKGGKSAEQIRTFYVVPNRAPLLTVNPFTPESGMINNDKVTFTGESADPDGNDVTVAYKLNTNVAVQIHSGVAGAWSFDLLLKDLKEGDNTIVVEVTDTYNFKSSRTIKFNKQANLTPLSESVQRSTIVPPSGSAQSVVLWVQRDADQTVEAEISMTTGSEQEQYVPMTLSNSAPTQSGAIEDEFIYQAFADKENIIVKFTISGTGPVTLISGVLS